MRFGAGRGALIYRRLVVSARWIVSRASGTFQRLVVLHDRVGVGRVEQAMHLVALAVDDDAAVDDAEGVLLAALDARLDHATQLVR
jgi:hypothetical protein